MMIERDRCRDTPRCCQGFKARWSDCGARHADFIRASGHMNRANRPLSLIAAQSTAGQREHMTATCNDQNQLKSILAKPGPSTHDSTHVVVRDAGKQKTNRVAKPDRPLDPVEPRGQLLQQGVAQHLNVKHWVNCFEECHVPIPNSDSCSRCLNPTQRGCLGAAATTRPPH